MTQLTLEIVAKTLFDAEIEAEVRDWARLWTSPSPCSTARYPFARLLNLLPLKSNLRFLKAE